jgi:hypothetical protein
MQRWFVFVSMRFRVQKDEVAGSGRLYSDKNQKKEMKNKTTKKKKKKKNNGPTAIVPIVAPRKPGKKKHARPNCWNNRESNLVLRPIFPRHSFGNGAFDERWSISKLMTLTQKNKPEKLTQKPRKTFQKPLKKTTRNPITPCVRFYIYFKTDVFVETLIVSSFTVGPNIIILPRSFFNQRLYLASVILILPRPPPTPNRPFRTRKTHSRPPKILRTPYKTTRNLALPSFHRLLLGRLIDHVSVIINLASVIINPASVIINLAYPKPILPDPKNALPTPPKHLSKQPATQSVDTPVISSFVSGLGD